MNLYLRDGVAVYRQDGADRRLLREFETEDEAETFLHVLSDGVHELDGSLSDQIDRVRDSFRKKYPMPQNGPGLWVRDVFETMRSARDESTGHALSCELHHERARGNRL